MAVHIIYGSETGNTESLAQECANKLNCSAMEADTFDPNSLEEGDTLLVMTSTWGDGEIPSNAQEFFSKLPLESLKGIRYAVFGTGSTNHPNFCQAAVDFDIQLKKSEANQLLSPVFSDEGYYQQDIEKWLEELLTKIQ